MRLAFVSILDSIGENTSCSMDFEGVAILVEVSETPEISRSLAEEVSFEGFQFGELFLQASVRFQHVDLPALGHPKLLSCQALRHTA